MYACWRLHLCAIPTALAGAGHILCLARLEVEVYEHFMLLSRRGVLLLALRLNAINEYLVLGILVVCSSVPPY